MSGTSYNFPSGVGNPVTKQLFRWAVAFYLDGGNGCGTTVVWAESMIDALCMAADHLKVLLGPGAIRTTRVHCQRSPEMGPSIPHHIGQYTYSVSWPTTPPTDSWLTTPPTDQKQVNNEEPHSEPLPEPKKPKRKVLF